MMRLLPRFRRAAKQLLVLEEREDWSRAQIESWQLERINEVWQHATRFVPHYRELQSELALPKQFETMSQFTGTVPVLDKSLVRDDPRRFLSEEPDLGQWHRTSGSTGKPMSVYWSHEAHRQHLHTKYRRDAMFGVDLFDRKAFVWGNPDRFANGISGSLRRWASTWCDRLRNRMRLVPYEMSETTRRKYVQELAKSKCKMIYGYASAMGQLALTAMQMRVTYPNLRFIVLSAEPVYAGDVELVEDAFGVPCVAEYGSVECGTIAVEGPERRLLIREDLCHVETIENRADVRTGSLGEPVQSNIIVSVLNNRSFPLLRYSIEDVTEAPIQFREIGFAELANVLGRSNDFLQSRSGELVHPMAIKHLMDSCKVNRFQAKQHPDGDISLLVESESNLPDKEINRIGDALCDISGGYSAVVRQTKRIPRTSAGKHRWIISEKSIEQ